MSEIVTMSPMKMVLNLIVQSNDDGLRGKLYRTREHLAKIYFSDVMDIVLYVISLQPDLKDIAKIETGDFDRLLEKVWAEWIKDIKDKAFDDIRFAWSPGPGPLGGTMGSAESYAHFGAGFRHHDYLLQFFSHPEDLFISFGNWPVYKRYNIEGMVFPKWRRSYNRKKLGLVLDLAEMVCKCMRENKKQTG